jgi:hypothetical protein
MAGYSVTPLYKKLGIKPGGAAVIVNEPEAFAGLLAAMPAWVLAEVCIERVGKVSARIPKCREADLILMFVKDAARLGAEFPEALKLLRKNGSLWVAWPKKASGVATDLNENIVRETGLRNGVVDVKVAAVDEVWSGLKFVYRLKDR